MYLPIVSISCLSANKVSASTIAVFSISVISLRLKKLSSFIMRYIYSVVCSGRGKEIFFSASERFRAKISTIHVFLQKHE